MINGNDEIKIQLHKEGFAHVFDWHDKPNVEYPEHIHKGKVSFYITQGSVTFSGGITKTINTDERFDVPVGISHPAKVGKEGCGWIVGEEIDDDS